VATGSRTCLGSRFGVRGPAARPAGRSVDPKANFCWRMTLVFESVEHVERSIDAVSADLEIFRKLKSSRFHRSKYRRPATIAYGPRRVRDEGVDFFDRHRARRSDGDARQHLLLACLIAPAMALWAEEAAHGKPRPDTRRRCLGQTRCGASWPSGPDSARSPANVYHRSYEVSRFRKPAVKAIPLLVPLTQVLGLT
jgi:hypothetical protein